MNAGAVWLYIPCLTSIQSKANLNTHISLLQSYIEVFSFFTVQEL